MKLLALVLAMTAVSANAVGQEPDEYDFQEMADDLIGYPDEDANLEDVYENGVQILSSPYDLNTVSADELRFLHILNDAQIENFISYRQQQGTLIDIYELQVIPGFGSDVVSRLRPYVRIMDPRTKLNLSLAERMFASGNSYLVTKYERTLQAKTGFTRAGGSPYQGSQDKIYTRFRSSRPGDFSLGLTGEKDAGERMKFDGGRQLGFDFTSFHLQIMNKGVLRNLVAGDFQAQFGQGLILGSAFGLGKGGETVLNTRKSSVGFIPYTSVNENVYQRGVALTIEPVRHVLFSAFYSRARRDASIDSSATITATSLQASGYHRTQTELRNRKVETERNYGLVMQWKNTDIEAGAIVNATTYALPINKPPTRYNQFTFQGARNVNAGFYLEYRLGSFSFFSEVAQSLNGGRGFLAGALMTPTRNLDVSIVCRNYQRDFHTFYANAFSESTQPQNERGFYWGWKYQWTRFFNTTGYVDLFSFPWLSFRRYAPSSGYEWLLRANYQPLRGTTLFAQLREESKPRNAGQNSALYILSVGRKRNATVNCDYRGGGKLRLKSRLQYSSYYFDEKTTRGFTLAQGATMSVRRFRFTASYALFDTDDFDNRQYVYENDAWLSFSFPAYSGDGVRNYVLIEYNLSKKVTLWARFATTRMRKENEIGSGLDTIEGNTRNDVKFQARFRF
jgi:hypothetical protein